MLKCLNTRYDFKKLFKKEKTNTNYKYKFLQLNAEIRQPCMRKGFKTNPLLTVDVVKTDRKGTK